MAENKDNYVEFVCPDCGRTAIDQVFDGPHTCEVEFLLSSGDFEYGDYQSQSVVDHMQCRRCAYVLKDKDGNNITDNIEAAKWCEDNCPQDEK